MVETIANQDVSRVLGRLNEWYDRMAQAGLSFDNLQTPIDDISFRKRLVDFWLSGAFTESSDQVRAREMMGHRFYGIGDLIRYFQEGFGLNNSPLSENYQDWLAEIPFNEAQMIKHSRTHIIFPGYDKFNIRWLLINKLGLSRYELDRDWRGKEPYVNKVYLGNRWYMLRIKPLPHSEDKTYDEQLAILPEDEEVPPACVVALGMAFYYLKFGHFPHTGYHLNCLEVNSSGERVFVGVDDVYGRFSVENAYVRQWRTDPLQDQRLGLATMVKLPTK